MYQPRIEDEYIRELYQWAKRLNMPMTRLVNALVAHALARLEQGIENVQESEGPRYKSQRAQHTGAAQRRTIDEQGRSTRENRSTHSTH